MFRIVGPKAKDFCDAHLRPTRRDLLRVGGAGMLGLSLGSLLKLQVGSSRRRRPLPSRLPAAAPVGARPRASSWSTCKADRAISTSGIPKPDAAENIRSTFKNIGTKIPGVNFTEILPKLAQINDRFTMIRSMSYTPNGLFNHTAAIYQMMTGYTTDKVSPSGQLEPPNAQDFPNFGSQIVRLKPPTEPMLPFVMLPRPLQESNVVGKGGTAGFLGKGVRSVHALPDGDDMDMAKMDRIKVDDLKMRPDVFAVRLERRAKLRDMINAQMPAVEKAVEKENLDEYYQRALEPGHLRPGPRCVRPVARSRRHPRPVRPQHVRPKLPARPPADRSRHARRRSRLAEGRQLRQPLVGPSRRPDQADEDPIGPDARHRPLGPDRRPGQARHARRHAASSRIGEFGRSPQRASAPRATATRPTAATTGRTATPSSSPAPASSAATSTARATRPPPRRSKTRSTRPNSWRRSTTPSASTRRRSSTTTSTSRASW